MVNRDTGSGIELTIWRRGRSYVHDHFSRLIQITDHEIRTSQAALILFPAIPGKNKNGGPSQCSSQIDVACLVADKNAFGGLKTPFCRRFEYQPRLRFAAVAIVFRRMGAYVNAVDFRSAFAEQLNHSGMNCIHGIRAEIPTTDTGLVGHYQAAPAQFLKTPQPRRGVGKQLDAFRT